MNVSLSEILLVLFIALLVIKPEQLPHAARALGKFVKSVQNMFSNVKNEVNGLIDSVDKTVEKKRE